MSRIKEIRDLVRNGLYYLTEHALHEAEEDGLDIYAVESSILSGRIRRSWPRQGKYEVVGPTRDGENVGVVCRITPGGKVRVITVYRDRPLT